MNVIMRGHGPGAMCECCNKRPGTAMVWICQLECWACDVCRGVEEDADNQGEQP